ncbi:hydroxyacid dehydrogenase [Luteipulveratus mongoliensis]|uniref:D-3-phosphoglycerate dehydrogenase n=1 Tax=Luteipulveratus mongoliensis TaxID=571913 RepID=A0A0K1JJL4_9MICO|nr:hydroxyacid dehydrogenase [Luteipulveratus mongoliensis]AKU16919.1 D-3-phosphoglycerate dehydrogenase [Luteipulveratus mongoliensis]
MNQPSDNAGAAASGLPRLVLAVAASERDAFFPPPADELGRLAQVRTVEPQDVQTLAEFSDVMGDADIVVTAWGFPRLDAERLAAAPRLRLVMHAAASVKYLVSDALWEREIVLSQAGSAMGPAVAELSLTATLSLLRRTHRMDHALRAGIDWDTAREIPRAREMSGSRIGVIGASRTGRAYITACQALGAQVTVYDPYLPADDPLHGVAQDLSTLVATSDVVAVHAPETSETHHLIGAAEISAMPDGALVVNTARSALLDMNALFEAASAGRIDVALDVFDTEPLPVDDRWRLLPNVLLTGHRGGATADSRRRAGLIVVDEIQRHLDGRPLQHAVGRNDLSTRG